MMRTLTIKANLLSGITHTVSLLSPEQKAHALGGDAVDANRLAVKAVADCETANKTFLDATKATYEKKTAALNAAKDKLKADQQGKSEAEAAKLGSDSMTALKAELDKLDSESDAKPDELVTFQLSDEKLEAVKKLLRPACSHWSDSPLYVEAADCLDAAVAS